jgi:hypothetical protein
VVNHRRHLGFETLMNWTVKKPSKQEACIHRYTRFPQQNRTPGFQNRNKERQQLARLRAPQLSQPHKKNAEESKVHNYRPKRSDQTGKIRKIEKREERREREREREREGDGYLVSHLSLSIATHIQGLHSKGQSPRHPFSKTWIQAVQPRLRYMREPAPFFHHSHRRLPHTRKEPETCHFLCVCVCVCVCVSLSLSLRLFPPLQKLLCGLEDQGTGIVKKYFELQMIITNWVL